MKLTVEEKIDQIIETQPSNVAIAKINGYLKLFFYNQNILNKLAELNYQNGNMVKAGQYWFFKENKSESEEMAVGRFKIAYGNDMKLVARKLIGHGFKSPKDLNEFTKNELFKILEEIHTTEGEIPDFAKNWYGHLKKGREI